MSFNDRSRVDPHPDYRAFRRHLVKSPVRIKGEGKDEPFPATVDNYGKGGAHIVTPVFLDTGRLVAVRAPRNALPEIELDDDGDIGVKVAWNRKSGKVDDIYGHESYEIGARWLPLKCDLCDKQVPLEKLHRTEELVTLCPSCHHDFEKLGTGHLGKSIYRRLMGNVL